VDQKLVADLVASRHAARAARNFELADQIRKKLDELDIQLLDKKNPTTGEIETTWGVKR
jgi:cysteinyl-tRNA synthetase